MNLPVTKYAAANQWCINYIEQQRAVKQLNSLMLQSIAIKKASAVPQDSSFLNQIKNIDFNALLQNPAVLAGLGSAAVGGGLTLAGDRKKKETGTGKVLRALGNAGIAGLLGGGAVGLLNKGTSDINTALPKDDVDPTTATLANPWLKTLSAATGLGLAQKFVPDPYTGRKSQELANIFAEFKAPLKLHRGEGGFLTGPATFDLRDKAKVLNALANKTDVKNKELIAQLANLFEGKGPLAANRYTELMGAATPTRLEELKQKLRYLNINPEEKLTFGRAKEQLKGMFYRGIDTRHVAGTGGRGFRLARGLGGAAAGYVAPTILAAVSNYFQNKD